MKPQYWQEFRRQAAQHEHCQLYLRRSGPHTGLYCCEHGYWFKWITPAERQVCETAGIVMLELTLEPKTSVANTQGMPRKIKSTLPTQAQRNARNKRWRKARKQKTIIG